MIKQRQHRQKPVADHTYEFIFEQARIHVLGSRDEFDDLLAFVGYDVCIFVFSTAVSDEAMRALVYRFADMKIMASTSMREG